MTVEQSYDIAVIGGGVKGATAAIHLARGGMRVVVLERTAICREASGVNAGTLSIQVKEPELVPYAMRSNEMWETAADWLGMDLGFRRLGGLSLAFTEAEAELLRTRVRDRVAAGAPIELVGLNRAREIEPALSDKPVLASYCPLDGFSNTTIVGKGFRQGLLKAGVAVREGTAVAGIDHAGDGYVVRLVAGDPIAARRVLMAGGIWLKDMLAWFGFDVSVDCRINQVSVTERLPPILRTVIGVASGRLSLKQAANGSVLIGGGWQGIGNVAEGGVAVIPSNLTNNLRLAKFAVPALGRARVVRTWLGMEGHSRGFVPVAGSLPGHPNLFVLGFVRGGYTIGPYVAKLTADLILGRQPEMPLFDPAQLLFATAPVAGRRAAAGAA